jgi:hypothetical protein
MTKFKQSGNGLLISYRQLNSSKNVSEGKMAMVKAIWYDLGSVDTIDLWEFLDVVDKDGVPLILKCDQWDTMLPLLQFRFFIWMILSFCFLTK